MEDNVAPKWYDYVISVGGLVKGCSVGLPTVAAAYTWGGPNSIRASVSPLTVMSPDGTPQVLWRWIQQCISPNGETSFMQPRGPAPVWKPCDLPEFARIIGEARRYPDALWGQCTLDRHDQDIYEPMPTPDGFSTAGHLRKIISHASRQVFVGVVVPTTLEIKHHGGLLKVELMLEYRQIFQSTIDKSANTVLGSTIAFCGFVL